MYNIWIAFITSVYNPIYTLEGINRPRRISPIKRIFSVQFTIFSNKYSNGFQTPTIKIKIFFI